ncbi:hypothetical protein [Winogradskya humida]|nr:hypothetical protein [Actinoplanes humidus]
MSKTSLVAFGDEVGKWLPVFVALGGVGVLPKGWKKVAGAAALLLALRGVLE